MTQEERDALRAQLKTMKADPDARLDVPVVFYSDNAPTLQLVVTIGKVLADENGQHRRMGEKIIEFSPMPLKTKQADGTLKHYGQYATDDPEVALFLLERGYYPNPKKGGMIQGDILLPADYIKAVTPLEEVNREIEARLLSTRNELEAHLAHKSAQDEALAAKEAENLKLRAQLAKLAGGSKGKAEEAEKVPA